MSTVTIPTLTRRRRLWLALDSAGMTAVEMADELGLSRSTVTRWLASDAAPIRPIYLKEWALRCGVPYTWLANEPTVTKPRTVVVLLPRQRPPSGDRYLPELAKAV